MFNILFNLSNKISILHMFDVFMLYILYIYFFFFKEKQIIFIQYDLCFFNYKILF